jgi:hypothetical protein
MVRGAEGVFAVIVLVLFNKSKKKAAERAVERRAGQPRPHRVGNGEQTRRKLNPVL